MQCGLCGRMAQPGEEIEETWYPDVLVRFLDGEERGPMIVCDWHATAVEADETGEWIIQGL